MPAEWYEVVSQHPGPEVTDATMRRKIEESGQPWKVRDRATGLEMVLVMPGEFLMGSPESESGRNADEGPRHRVRLTKAFYLGVTEVTQAQWKRSMGSLLNFFQGDSKPVEASWAGAQAFLANAHADSQAGTESLRLPTEAEWEYACRAGTPGPFNRIGFRVPRTLHSHNSSTDPAATDAPALLRFGHGYMPNGMWNPGVRSILEDSKGNYWFGSSHEGVCRFDGESLTYFTEEDGLSNNQIRTILEDRKGVIWFEMGNGISSYDGERIITHTNRNYTSKDDWRRLETGDLWFKGDEGHGVNELEGEPGVYRYDGEEFTYLAFPLPEDRGNVGTYSVTGMAKGKGGKLWFATYAAVIGYDGESFTIIDNESLGLNEETGWLAVRCVFEDSNGRLWIGNNGIGVFLQDGDTTINFTQENGVGRRDHRSGGKMAPQPGDVSDGSASLQRVFSIGEDRTGNIWFGTAEQGAWRYDGESLRRFTEEDGLATKGVMVIYTDSRGDLWLGGDGVYKFNGESFDRIH